ncbi:CMGC protein kinase [Mariannaea sp. PMI_226]|nr:CMGC protein kinase [Mariannaea sp. PMI_226]
MGRKLHQHPRLRASRPFGLGAFPSPIELPNDTLVDEEKLPSYEAQHYYDARPGEVLADLYQLIVKIGWGSSSTVWLAQSIAGPEKEYVAIKILNHNQSLTSEQNIHERLIEGNSNHFGHSIVGTANAALTFESPQGKTHVGLILDLFRETWYAFRYRLNGQDYITTELGLLFAKLHMRLVLEGLDYMHSECHMIHTDLKMNSIMVNFEDKSVIDAFAKKWTTHPMSCKRDTDRTVYRSENEYGPPALKALGNMILRMIDFGSVHVVDDDEMEFRHYIQPNEYRAPEVLLGTGWRYSVDIWNFGVMVWELLSGKSLFHQPDKYSAAQHLADMIALLGDVPPSLIKLEKEMRHLDWFDQDTYVEGRLVKNASECFGGPFFDDDGKFVHGDLIRQARGLEAEVPDCIREANEVDQFLAFMRRMLTWVPGDRATAAELLDDPWLDVGTPLRVHR